MCIDGPAARTPCVTVPAVSGVALAWVVHLVVDMRTQRIKQQLLERRRGVLSRYQGELERAAEELESHEAEVVQHATEQWDAEVLTRLSDVDAASLKRIIGALRRVEDGSYGSCRACGTAIQPARLQVLPEADACISCANKAEHAFTAGQGG